MQDHIRRLIRSFYTSKHLRLTLLHKLHLANLSLCLLLFHSFFLVSVFTLHLCCFIISSLCFQFQLSQSSLWVFALHLHFLTSILILIVISILYLYCSFSYSEDWKRCNNSAVSAVDFVMIQSQHVQLQHI